MWATIPGYPDFECSDEGLVRVASSKKIRKPFLDRSKNLWCVSLKNNDGRRVSINVARVVYLCFCDSTLASNTQVRLIDPTCGYDIKNLRLHVNPKHELYTAPAPQKHNIMADFLKRRW